MTSKVIRLFYEVFEIHYLQKYRQHTLTATFLLTNSNYDGKYTDCALNSFGRSCGHITCQLGVPRRQPHRRSGLATLPSVGAVP